MDKFIRDDEIERKKIDTQPYIYNHPFKPKKFKVYQESLVKRRERYGIELCYVCEDELTDSKLVFDTTGTMWDNGSHLAFNLCSDTCKDELIILLGD